MHVRPGRLLHGLPVPKRLQAPVEQELRLLFLERDRAHDVFIESRRQAVGLDVGDEAVPILLAEEGFDFLRFA